MIPTLTNHVIFENTTEARVTAHFLNRAGRADLVANFEPPLEEPPMGRVEFITQLHGQAENDGIEYVSPDAKQVIITLGQAVGMEAPGRIPPLNRRQYMSRKLFEFAERATELAETTRRSMPVAIELGNAVLITRPEAVEPLLARHRFSQAYAAERGWDIDNITIEQVMEIRSQPGWQNPQGESQA